MRITIYGKTFNPGFKPFIQELFETLRRHNTEVFIYRPFYDFLTNDIECNPKYDGFFSNVYDTPEDIDFMISIGGDGTFLEAIQYVRNFDIPLIGLNSGRLGFLANISKEEITSAFEAIYQKNYEFEYRSLLRLETTEKLFGDMDYALNEVTLQKKDSSLITVDAYLNDEFLNTYWTDGLIVSTPTGSTAYSLSVGGPIVLPSSNNFIILPIASHNLTVRPIVIPDDHVIKLKVNSRSKNLLVTLDNRTIVINDTYEFTISKANFKLKMLKLPDNNFYGTIRNKLMWGVDKRN
jgi:NAD+ kinase